MPKSRGRKQANRSRQGSIRVAEPAASRSERPADGNESRGARGPGSERDRGAGRRRVSSYQTLVMPAMVALGCWGLAASFIFFTPDPNHLLFGGIAVLMALMWSVSFWLRLRRLQQQ